VSGDAVVEVDTGVARSHCPPPPHDEQSPLHDYHTMVLVLMQHTRQRKRRRGT